MSPSVNLPGALTLALLAVATVCDIRSRRIPNLLTVPMALLGIGLHAALGGWPGAQQAAIGCIVGLAVLLVPCLLGVMGGGDMKLLGAVGALQGAQLALTAGLYGAVAGGVLSLAVLAVERRRAGHTAASPTAGRPARKTTLPYGPALAAGTLIALALG